MVSIISVVIGAAIMIHLRSFSGVFLGRFGLRYGTVIMYLLQWDMWCFGLVCYWIIKGFRDKN